MMFLGNQNEAGEKERKIYFIDSKKNFWYIKDLPSITNIEKIFKKTAK